MNSSSEHSLSDSPRRFATTRWSLVLSAGDRQSVNSTAALQALCQTYWYPLYAFARRQGRSPEASADQTQEFFARLCEQDLLQRADQQRGRFRSFLLTLFKRFLAHEFEKSLAQKRGGGHIVLSINMVEGEERYQFEPADNWTPERLFERRWAMTLLDQVLARLEQEFAAKGKQALFARCKPLLIVGDPAASSTNIAEELGISETALRVTLHRMRQRYRELLRDEIRQTVDSEAEVDEELQLLRSVIRGE